MSEVAEISRSGFKIPSNTESQRGGPPQNAHILLCMLRFFVGPRLDLRRDLRFSNHFQTHYQNCTRMSKTVPRIPYVFHMIFYMGRY